MKHKYILGALFIAMIFIQWFVPAKMIIDREDILKNGVPFKFECEPLDPYDPFRGKYITLRFAERQFITTDSSELKRGEQIYVKLINKSDGFVRVDTVFSTPPSDMNNIVKAKIGWDFLQRRESTRLLSIDYPFNNFYMEESKALPAEELYREMVSDSSKLVYALVMIKEGEAVLKDVLIDEISIQDAVLK